MASGNTKTIEEIDDVRNMLQVMDALGISCEGCKTLDQMKTRVREEFKLSESLNKPSWTAGQVRNEINVNSEQEVFFENPFS